MQQKQRYKVLNWNKNYEHLIKLAKKVNESGFKPEVIVGISRGGLIPSRIISDLLDNPNLASIRVEFYEYTKKREKPKITQPISMPIEGKKILLVDDVADSGKSLQLVYKHLSKKAKEIRTLTIFYKPWSCLQPDYYIKETRAWIVFPWEFYETVRWIVNKTIDEEGTLEKVKNNLTEMGFDSSIIERFVRDLWNGAI
uniref:Phosphoribosyltransferase n=1 Tax=uncultured marine crenarchaeote E37-7F TaxID=907717 RepID=G9BAN3_9ARCH|nr:phosphoribosyltransferase [uncultured marine crenarchaeote E37-7F]